VQSRPVTGIPRAKAYRISESCCKPKKNTYRVSAAATEAALDTAPMD
jgi:hypothetical protein